MLKSSQWIVMSRFQMEMFWGFQKGIIHVSIPNGCGVGSFNQEGLITCSFRPLVRVFYSRGSSIRERLIIVRIRYVAYAQALSFFCFSTHICWENPTKMYFLTYFCQNRPKEVSFQDQQNFRTNLLAIEE